MDKNSYTDPFVHIIHSTTSLITTFYQSWLAMLTAYVYSYMIQHKHKVILFTHTECVETKLDRASRPQSIRIDQIHSRCLSHNYWKTCLQLTKKKPLRHRIHETYIRNYFLAVYVDDDVYVDSTSCVRPPGCPKDAHSRFAAWWFFSCVWSFGYTQTKIKIQYLVYAR